MWSYILRRVLYSIPILICVNIITFILFFFVNTPDDVAHVALGQKYSSPVMVYRWKREHSYHLPLLLNTEDTVVYLNGKRDIPSDITDALDGYEIRHGGLDSRQVADKLERMEKEKADSQKIDSFDSQVRELARGFTNNEIVVIDWDGLSKSRARVLAGLMEKGVDVVFIAPRGQPVPEPLDNPVVRVLRIDDSSTREQVLSDLRTFIDKQQTGFSGMFTQTLFFNKSVRLFWFDFGKSDRENVDISYQIVSRMGASLMITVPAFILGLLLNIFISMIVAYARGTYLDRMMAVICIIIMSILSLFYYFITQYAFGMWLKVFPISGYAHGLSAVRFVMAPVLVTVFIGIGRGVRFYRTIFLEEINSEYVKTARAKGLSEIGVLFKHVLKNAMIPVLTNVVVVIPALFMGSLILESFFAIPGLGRFTLEGIRAQDFRIVGSMVYLGSFLYIVGLLMTDISYTLVDPRVRLE